MRCRIAALHWENIMLKKIQMWYGNIVWYNLPLLFIAVVILISIPFLAPGETADAAVKTLRSFLIILCAVDILLCARGYKPTERGLYSTFLGIPYRFIPCRRITGVCIAAERWRPLLLITLDDIVPFSEYRKHAIYSLFGYRLRHLSKCITVYYTTRNAAILRSFFGPFDTEG